MAVRFTRVLTLGDTGSDCEGVARALIREGSAGVTLTAFNKQTNERRETWNDQKCDWLKKYERKLGDPFSVDGIYGKAVHLELTPHFDALAASMMLTWRPPPPPLVEPKQGWHTLHNSLYQIYSIGRQMGLFDLGTYNPASDLPSGNPSDHSVYPAYAFDLGIDPDIGYDHDVGRAYFSICMRTPAVEYVILGTKIGQRRTGLISYYGYGGHQNHVHVSGNR
jgi:hypothetical protein